MRFNEQAQQWVHTVQEEEAFGLQRTRRADMPPSIVKSFDEVDAETARLRDRLSGAIHLLEQARQAHLHDALGQLILQWMQSPGGPR